MVRYLSISAITVSFILSLENLHAISKFDRLRLKGVLSVTRLLWTALEFTLDFLKARSLI
jgi:hypothetical protein